ncbi:MAG: hypothetical protein N2748_02165 [candidate division WOR-3 bacterium]|nr:hypothetical protein [candidate division WOR-3 bacterium]
MRRKIFNCQFLSKNYLLLIFFLYPLISLFAETNNYPPLSYFTDFQIKSKNANQIEIRVDNATAITNELIEKIVNEFNFIKLPYIYYSKLIAIPKDGDVQIVVKNYDSLIIPYGQTIDIARNKTTDNMPLVSLGKSGIMRNLKVAPLIVRQYYFDNTNRNIICYNNFDIKIEFNRPLTQFNNLTNISNDWLSFYEKSILNFDKNIFASLNSGLPQGYLIIVADNLYNNILPLARW